MKRGKEDEKMMGPLFPRLHVNDTEKGGPRAPPRNKMALYEQLSIPSQRFNSGGLPRNPSNLAPSVSSTQGSGIEKTLSSPLQVSTLADQLHLFQPSAGNSNGSLAPSEQRKKAGDDDDFAVPIFVNTGVAKLQRKCSNGEELVLFRSVHSGHSNRAQNAGNNDAQCASSIDPHLRLGGNPCISSDNLQIRENFAEPGEEGIAHPKKRSQGNQEKPAWLQSTDCALGDAVPELRRKLTEKNDVLVRKDSLGSSEETCTFNEGSGTCVDKLDVSLRVGDIDKSDDASETSIVDSAEPSDISPDDVVDIIGQKQFWKARKAIVNQQRVFAVQVFELHRLIKVQQLFAGSPHLLVEESNYLAKSSIPGSPMKKLQTEYLLVQPTRGNKRKDDSREPIHNKMEGSAENAVGKSLGKDTQPSSIHRQPHVGNQAPVPAVTDSNNTSSWCFNQPTGQQWLVPVMSPTEGLVYKPYTPPGSMGPGCGGYGPYGPPVMGNFMNPGYGVPTYFQQGIGCYPPYGTSVMTSAVSESAVDKSNCFPGSGSHGQISQLSGSGANFNVQHNVELVTQKNGAVSVAEIRISTKEAELQRSTASSVSERLEVVGSIQQRGDRRDDPSLYLFPRAPSTFRDPHEAGHVSRVIRVVPHNSRSATESAARIFQSIQEERKQNESV